MADVAAMDIIIGANVQGAVTGFNTVQKELAQTAVAAAKVDSSFGKVSKGANKATQSLTDVGRVAQDLPYVFTTGFGAIANNINPLFESFERLKKETGSTKAAFKEMAAGLMGPGGIGLAISVVTSLIVIFGDKLFSTSKETDDAAKATEEFAKSLESARAGALSTGVQLQNFLNIARDTTKPLEQRNEALKEANKLMGEHGQKITLANIGTKAITDQTNLFTEALINQAIAVKYADRIADLIIKQTEAARKYGEEQKKFKLLQTDLNQLSQVSVSAGQINTTTYNELAIAQGQVTEKAEEYKTVTKDLNQVYIDFAITSDKATAALGKIGEKTKASTKHIKTAADVMKDFNKEMDFLNEKLATIGGEDLRGQMLKTIQSTIDSLIKLGIAGDSVIVQGLVKQFEDLAQTIPIADAAITKIIGKLELHAGKVPKLERPFTPVLDVPFEKATEAQQRAADQLKFFNDNIEGIMKAAQSLQGVFENVFSSIASGGKNMVQSLLQSLEQLIIKLAAAALAAVLINAAFGGGVGLIFGKLTGLKGLIPGMAGGGIVTGPTAALIGEAGPEVVFPLDRLREFIQPNAASVVVLETQVRGNDLYLIQSRTQQRRNRTY
jgi:hypothetical protein